MISLISFFSCRISIRIFSVFIMAFGFLSACKSASTSDIKTLDAIASGGITKLYQCRGKNEVRIKSDKIIFDRQAGIAGSSESEKEILREAVTDYFSAIDPAMQELFLKLGGSILITDQDHIGDYCRTARSQSAEGNKAEDLLHACFTFIDDPSGARASIFTIVHTASAEKIRYFGPQIFGYLYAQFYSRLAPAKMVGASFSVNSTEAVQFITYKENIADAFLKDMLATSKYNIENLSPILGSNSTSELRAFTGQAGFLDALSLRKSSDTAELGSAEKERRRAQIRDFFFANAYQSMNCNAEALDVTRKNFPHSAAAYIEINDALLRLSSELTGIHSSQSSNSETFALTDGGEGGSDRRQVSKSISKAGGLDFLTLLQSLMPMIGPMLGKLGIPGLSSLSGTFGGLLGGGGGGLLGGGMTPGGQKSPAALQNSFYNAANNAGLPAATAGSNVLNGGALTGGVSGTTTAGGLSENVATLTATSCT